METMQHKPRILNVFVVKEHKKDGHLEIMSNRELVWSWMRSNGYDCLIDIPGKPPYIVKTYKKLCELWTTMPLLQVYLYRTGETPASYQLVKMQVKNK